jgi:hypothetical protein
MCIIYTYSIPPRQVRHAYKVYLSGSAAVRWAGRQSTPLGLCFGHSHFRGILLSTAGEFLLYYAVLCQIRIQSEFR